MMGHQPQLFVWPGTPLVLALLAGLMIIPIVRNASQNWNISQNLQKTFQTGVSILGIVLAGALAIRGLDILDLAKTAMVATMVAGDPLAEAAPQEALSIFWLRPVLMVLAGALLAAGAARPGDKSLVVHSSDVKKAWMSFAGLIVFTLIATLIRESGPIAVLLWDANLRFLLVQRQQPDHRYPGRDLPQLPPVHYLPGRVDVDRAEHCAQIYPPGHHHSGWCAGSPDG
jgi:hypothetical protein